MLASGITIGIPAYNARLTLERALDSALAQTARVPFEVIVVDDGSTDTTANIGRAYALMFPDTVRFLRTENRGVAAARNTIVDEARFDHLTWLDADDYYHPEKLERQYDALLMEHMINKTIPGDPNVLVFSAFRMGNRSLSFGDYFHNAVPHILAGRFRAYLWASMVGTAAYRAVGPFNESLHRSEDTDWLLRYFMSAHRLILSTGDDPIMTYHFSNDRDGRKVEDSFDYMLATYGQAMRDCGVFDEYVPRRYWEISNFYHKNKAWNDMWRCRALAAKHDWSRYGDLLNIEIGKLSDRRHRSEVEACVQKYVANV